MPSSTLGRGNILYDFLIGPTLTPVSVAANTSAEQSFTIKGLLVGDCPDINFNGAQTAGIGIVNVRVSAVDTLTVMFVNDTSGGLTPAAGQYFLNIARPENLPLPTNAV